MKTIRKSEINAPVDAVWAIRADEYDTISNWPGSSKQERGLKMPNP